MDPDTRAVACSSAELVFSTPRSAGHVLALRLGTRLACLVSPQLFWITAAIVVKSIIEVQLSTLCFVIVILLSGGQTFESFGDSLKTPKLRSQVLSSCIGTAHKGHHSNDHRIRYLALLYDRIEETFLA